MQANIHPEYKEITVKCSCGHSFVTGSALGKDLHIEVCNECHPFYTGKQKIVDTAGRVERFKGKFSKLGSLKVNPVASSEAKAEKPKAAPKKEVKPASKAKTEKKSK